jgi:hypothetical protein
MRAILGVEQLEDRLAPSIRLPDGTEVFLLATDPPSVIVLGPLIDVRPVSRRSAPRPGPRPALAPRALPPPKPLRLVSPVRPLFALVALLELIHAQNREADCLRFPNPFAPDVEPAELIGSAEQLAEGDGAD